MNKKKKAEIMEARVKQVAEKATDFREQIVIANKQRVAKIMLTAIHTQLVLMRDSYGADYANATDADAKLAVADAMFANINRLIDAQSEKFEADKNAARVQNDLFEPGQII